MNQANPMLSSLCIFSAVNEDFSPLQNCLYSARCVETHRPRAVFSLNLVGTWQLPNLAVYWMSSLCVKKRQKGIISRHQRGTFLNSFVLSTSTYIFLVPSNLPPAFRPPESNVLESFQSFISQGRDVIILAILMFHALLVHFWRGQAGFVRDQTWRWRITEYRTLYQSKEETYLIHP